MPQPWDFWAGLSPFVDRQICLQPPKTIVLNPPGAIPRFDEPELSGGDDGIAENLGVVNRVDPVQAARHHGPAAFSAVIDVILRGRGNRAESAQGQCGGKHDERVFSTHGILPSVYAFYPLSIAGAVLCSSGGVAEISTGLRAAVARPAESCIRPVSNLSKVPPAGFQQKADWEVQSGSRTKGRTRAIKMRRR
jgi:hypothetical protein